VHVTSLGGLAHCTPAFRIIPGVTILKALRSLLLSAAILTSATVSAHAQSGLDVYFGVGTATADSNGTSIDTFNTGNVSAANTTGFFNTPKITGAFGKAGADFMLTRHFGLGADVDWRFSQGDYAGLNYRPTFYDFYGIWQPITRVRRIVPEFTGGLGAAKLSFFYPQSYCDAFAGCSSSNTFVESSNHFQIRMGAGVAFYATDHIFIRPQVDAHWINNFYQFGSNWVPEYSVSVGYRFGER
jgi:outer membrane protein W